MNANTVEELSAEDLDLLLDDIGSLSNHERAVLMKLIETAAAKKEETSARGKFIPFVRVMWPEFINGTHHKFMARTFERIIQGEEVRMVVNLPPRHSKSSMLSHYFPAWFLGHFPKKKIIQVSHTADLAVDFGRKVRNLIHHPDYKRIFPDTMIAKDSAAAGAWKTTLGGEYFAIGVGGALAGRGGDLIIVDDPHSEQDVKTGDPAVFDRVYEWWQTGARQRVQPGASLLVLHCLVGGTKVRLEDGSDKDLRDIRPGDMVVSYDAGTFRPAKVLNWASQGVDRVFTIALKSGNLLRGNERHPFLVSENGVERWTKIRDLKSGMQLVSTKSINSGLASNYLPAGKQGTTRAVQKGAYARLAQKLKAACAEHARQKLATIESIQTPRIGLSAPMGNGSVKRASLKGAGLLYIVKACALAAIRKQSISSAKPRGYHTTSHYHADKRTSRLGTESPTLSTISYLPTRMGYVPSAMSHPTLETLPQNGHLASWLLTTAMIPAKFVGYYVTHVTSLLKTATQSAYSEKPSSTLAVELDEIVSITEDGDEEVFDIQVEGIENFLANGVVSHNTRWSRRDLTGRLVANMAANPDADQWEVVEFPAILPSGKPLWPEFWSLESLLKLKNSIETQYWNAQYQQNPTSEEGAVVKREWWKYWEHEDPPECNYVIAALDTAAETKTFSDYSAMSIWGVFFLSADGKTEAKADDEDAVANVILLNTIKKRMEFPELKVAIRDIYAKWKPDTLIVEKKGSGTALYQELRRSGLPVSEFTPSRATGDKRARLNSVSDLVKSGLVWVPRTRWAEELVEEVASFPASEHDDLLDTFVMSMLRLRMGGFLTIHSDKPVLDDEESLHPTGDGPGDYAYY